MWSSTKRNGEPERQNEVGAILADCLLADGLLADVTVLPGAQSPCRRRTSATATRPGGRGLTVRSIESPVVGPRLLFASLLAGKN
jgi:hypothetical protein